MKRLRASAPIETRLAALRPSLRRRSLRRRALLARDAGTALRCGEAIGRLCWLNFDGLLADDALEAALDERHGAVLHAPAQRTVPDRAEWDWLHVLGEAYDIGGHTRLAEVLMAEQTCGGARVAAVATRAGAPRFERRCAEAGGARPGISRGLAERASGRTPAPDAPVISMGSADKCRPVPDRDVPAFVEHLLARIDRPFELIGPTGHEPRRRGAAERFAGRLRFAGALPFQGAAARPSSAACYIDGSPMGGATALPQALSAGLTVFGLGGETGDCSPLDALRSRAPEDLVEEIAAFLQGGIEPPLQAELRRRLEADFSAAAVAAGLEAAADGRPAPLPPEMASPGRGPDFHPQAWRARAIVLAPAADDAPAGQRLAVVAASLRDPRVRRPPRSRRDRRLHGGRDAAAGGTKPAGPQARATPAAGMDRRAATGGERP